MEINKVVIAKKSVINFLTREPIRFGDLIEVKFKYKFYFFNVFEIKNSRDSKVLFVKAEQTGSSYSKLSDMIKGEDISEFTISECEIVTDLEVIKNVNESSCYC